MRSGVRVPLAPPRRSKVRFTPIYFFTKISHPPVPLLILFRKRVRSRRLFAGKRAYNGFGSLPIFCELGGFLLFCLFFVVPFLPVESLDTHFAFGAFVIPIFRYLRMWDVFFNYGNIFRDKQASVKYAF